MMPKEKALMNKLAELDARATAYAAGKKIIRQIRRVGRMVPNESVDGE